MRGCAVVVTAKSHFRSGGICRPPWCGALTCILVIRPRAVHNRRPILRSNYPQAVRALGGVVLWREDQELTARVQDGPQPVWVRVNSLFGELTLDTVEESM